LICIKHLTVSLGDEIDWFFRMIEAERLDHLEPVDKQTLVEHGVNSALNQLQSNIAGFSTAVFSFDPPPYQKLKSNVFYQGGRATEQGMRLYNLFTFFCSSLYGRLKSHPNLMSTDQSFIYHRDQMGQVILSALPNLIY
jgi:hypothetical protein